MDPLSRLVLLTSLLLVTLSLGGAEAQWRKRRSNEQDPPIHSSNHYIFRPLHGVLHRIEGFLCRNNVIKEPCLSSTNTKKPETVPDSDEFPNYPETVSNSNEFPMEPDEEHDFGDFLEELDIVTDTEDLPEEPETVPDSKDLPEEPETVPDSKDLPEEPHNVHDSEEKDVENVVVKKRSIPIHPRFNFPLHLK